MKSINALVKQSLRLQLANSSEVIDALSDSPLREHYKEINKRIFNDLKLIRAGAFDDVSSETARTIKLISVAQILRRNFNLEIDIHPVDASRIILLDDVSIKYLYQGEYQVFIGDSITVMNVDTLYRFLGE